MCRVILLLTAYILLNYCNNALGEPQINSEDDIVKPNAREDLMGMDYYNGGNDFDGMNNREEDDLSSNKLNTNDYDEIETNYDVNADAKNIVVLDSIDVRNYKAEIKAGNMADILGTNSHYYQPETYPDFSRRFVPQYPYKEVTNKNKDEIEIDKLTPKLASPELVMAVAKESAVAAAAEPLDPTDEQIRKDILRTGNYWNAVWKEDSDPWMLRTNKKDKKLETVRAEIPPGTELHKLVSKLKELSPTLLYVINDKAK